MTSCDVNKKCSECEKDEEECPLPNVYAADGDGGITFLCGRCGESIAGNYFDYVAFESNRCYRCGHIISPDNVKYIWTETEEEPNFEENFKD